MAGYFSAKSHGYSNKDIATNYMTGGLFASTVESGRQRDQQKKQYEEEQARVAAETARRHENVNALRAAFGLGDTPNAQANAKRLNDYLNDYYKAFLTNQLGQVDTQYTGATRQSRQNLARVGQLGSGLDAANKTQTLSDYLRGRQDAVARAAAAREGLGSQLAGQRQSLEGQINSGAAVNPDFNSYIAQQLATIDAAKAQIPANTVGNVFRIAGEGYRNGVYDQTQGNQGLSAFFGGGGGSGGRIS